MDTFLEHHTAKAHSRENRSLTSPTSAGLCIRCSLYLQCFLPKSFYTPCSVRVIRPSLTPPTKVVICFCSFQSIYTTLFWYKYFGINEITLFTYVSVCRLPPHLVCLVHQGIHRAQLSDWNGAGAQH